MNLRKILLTIMLAALAASALTGIAIIFLRGDEIPGRLLGTSMVTAITSALLIPLASALERPKVRTASLVAMATLFICWLCGMILIWGDFFKLDSDWRAAVTLLFTLMTGLPAALILPMLSAQRARIAARTFVYLAGVVWFVAVAGAWS